VFAFPKDLTMSEDLVFPRLIYRGDPDTLGTGANAKGVALNSETKRCESAEAFKADEKDGWRLTRERPTSKAEQAKEAAAAEAPAAPKPAAPVADAPPAAPKPAAPKRAARKAQK
jgi:hypothetical protein